MPTKPGPKTGRRTALRATVAMAAVVTTGVATAGAAFAGGSGPPDSPTSTFEVIASGLNNPRHISASPSGALYVAESGVGAGATPNDQATCLAGAEGWECAGTTGSVARISRGWHGWTQQEVLTGLPSLAANGQDAAGNPDPAAAPGSSATGPSAVTVSGVGRFVVSVGLGLGCGTEAGPGGPASPTGPDPSCDPRTAAGISPLFGTLLGGSLSGGKVRPIADIAAHEFATNPIDNPDSNPAAVLRWHGKYLVADAGGNTIVAAGHDGRVSTVAAFPDTMVPAPPFLGLPPGAMMPMQAVPTAVAVGPDRALYVSQLTGFPFPAGGSTIWRVVPGHAPTAYATGLTNVTDLAFGRNGALYAVEISAAGLASGGPPIGALVQVGTGAHIGQNAVVADGLFAPYGLVLRGHDAYVTTGSVLPGTAPNPTPTTSCGGSTCTGGEVVRIPLS